MQEAIKRAIKQDTKSDPIGEDSPKGGAEASKDAWGDDSDTEDHDSTKKRRGVKPSAKQILLIPGSYFKCTFQTVNFFSITCQNSSLCNLKKNCDMKHKYF